RDVKNVLAAQYATVTDAREGARSHAGLVTVVGSPADARLEARLAWRAFRDEALGRDTEWHGPANPGMAFQGQPPTPQFTHPIPYWGANGAWQLHRLFPREGDEVLGRKAGYYAAGEAERFGQVLTDSFVAGRRYCFRSVAQGGRDDEGVLPHQIGYIDRTGN